MRKTIIYLPVEIVRWLKHEAVDLDISMAELIRRAVAEYMAKPTARRKAVHA